MYSDLLFAYEERLDLPPESHPSKNIHDSTIDIVSFIQTHQRFTIGELSNKFKISHQRVSEILSVLLWKNLIKLTKTKPYEGSWIASEVLDEPINLGKLKETLLQTEKGTLDHSINFEISEL